MCPTHKLCDLGEAPLGHILPIFKMGWTLADQ